VKVKKGELVGELEDYDPTYMAPEISPVVPTAEGCVGTNQKGCVSQVGAVG